MLFMHTREVFLQPGRTTLYLAYDLHYPHLLFYCVVRRMQSLQAPLLLSVSRSTPVSFSFSPAHVSQPWFKFLVCNRLTEYMHINYACGILLRPLALQLKQEDDAQNEKEEGIEASEKVL